MSGRSNIEDNIYVTKIGINFPPHLRHTPFYDVAKVLIVDVVILSSHGSLSALLELVLTMSVSKDHKSEARTSIYTERILAPGSIYRSQELP